MDCRKFEGYLVDFILGELDPETEIQINEHLETCVSCRTELEKCEVLKEFLHSEMKFEPAADVYGKIQTRTSLATKSRDPFWFFSKTLVFSLGAFILGIILMRSVDLFMLHRSPKIETRIEYKQSVKEYCTDTVQFYAVPTENLVRL